MFDSGLGKNLFGKSNGGNFAGKISIKLKVKFLDWASTEQISKASSFAEKDYLLMKKFIC